MTSLYNLSAEYQALLDKEELTDLDLMEIDKLHADIEDRVVYYATIIKEMEGKVAMTKTVIENATQKKRRMEANIQRLQEYVTAAMISSNLTKVDKSPYFDVRIRNNPISVQVSSDAEIPDEYYNAVTELKLDKQRVKADIENLGLVFPGVQLVRNISLQIK